MIFYFFIILTIAVVILNEKLENLIIKKFFKKYLAELEEIEKKIAEYQYLSMLAIVAKDKEAYKGFQDMINEIYWPFFFRKIIFVTSLYFLLLSPYMILSNYLLKNKISTIIFIAIAFFTLKLGYDLIKNSYHAWKEAKRVEQN